MLAVAIFGEDEQHQAVALLRGHLLSAPHLVDYEMISVASLKEAPSRTPVANAVVASLDAYTALSIERHVVDPPGRLPTRLQCMIHTGEEMVRRIHMRAVMSADLYPFDRRILSVRKLIDAQTGSVLPW